MKRLIFFVVLACTFFMVACGDHKNEYVVIGTVPDSSMNGNIVYMTDLNDGQIVDSTKLADGKFEFKGIADSAMARALTIGDYDVKFILEKGNITVDMSDPYSVKGSPLSELWSEFSSKYENVVSDVRTKLNAIDKTLPDTTRERMQEQIFDDMYKDMNSIPQPYLDEHPNDVFGAMVFQTWISNQKNPSADFFEKSSQKVGDNVKNFGPIKQMAIFFDKIKRTAEGQKFTDFTIEKGNIDGSSVSLSDYVGNGKYVLVDFWASWCGPCRKETPNIAAVYNKYKGDKFDVVSVAVWDNRENTLKAIDEDGNKWPQIVDAQTIPTELYGIRGIPHIILFGPDGTIISRDLRGKALQEKVAEVMK